MAIAETLPLHARRNDDAVQVQLTKGKSAIVDAEDEARVRAHSWHAIKVPHSGWYASAKIGGRPVSLHRFVLGITDRKIEIDHIDLDGLDNRKENLRTATRAQNAANMAKPSTNTSGYKGVDLDRAKKASKSRPWRARLMVDGKRIQVGRFRTAEEAARAYDAAAREHCGAFARLNFPLDQERSA